MVNSCLAGLISGGFVFRVNRTEFHAMWLTFMCTYSLFEIFLSAIICQMGSPINGRLSSHLSSSLLLCLLSLFYGSTDTIDLFWYLFNSNLKKLRRTFGCFFTFSKLTPFQLEILLAGNFLLFVFVALKLDGTVTWSWGVSPP